MSKKILLVVAVLVLALSFTGCGNKKGNGFATTTPSPSAGAITPPTVHVCGGEVVLGDYALLDLSAISKGVSEADVEKEFNTQLEEVLAEYPNYVRDESRDGTEVKEGDTVNIDYIGKLDGVAFDGGKDTDYDLTIGSHTFIEDFETGLIGKQVGTTVDIETKFPDTYQNEELRGKVTVFTITINYIGQKKEGADDTYINRLSKGTYPTMNDFRNALKAEMEKQAEAEYEDRVYDAVINQMVENSQFVTILDEDIKYYEDDMIGYYKEIAEYYGMAMTDVATQLGFSDYDKFLDNCHEEAIKNVKQYMVLQKIVADEKIVVSDEKYTELLNGYMSSTQTTDRESFENTYSKEYLNYCMVNDLALELLVEKAKSNAQ